MTLRRHAAPARVFPPPKRFKFDAIMMYFRMIKMILIVEFIHILTAIHALSLGVATEAGLNRILCRRVG